MKIKTKLKQRTVTEFLIYSPLPECQLIEVEKLEDERQRVFVQVVMPTDNNMAATSTPSHNIMPFAELSNESL
jgi:hypothetical protein